MLLERDEELDLLAGLLAGVGSGGKVVLIRGEAGIGKSSLVREFGAAHSDEAHVLVGFCDDLLTPQPLGPFWDIARDERSLLEPLENDDRLGVLTGCLDLLSRSPRPTVLVIEDTHWADEATLDAIKYLGRRIARTNALVLVTYRDGEVDFDHPLRTVIGELPPENLVRVHLERLSTRAVARLVEDTELALDAVIALTGGNPLFVTEMVASGIEDVLSSIQDSVLARASKLSPEARIVLDLVSVIPGLAEHSLIETILDLTQGQLTECMRQGLLVDEGEVLRFRHELSRQAVESSLDTGNRRQLNMRVLSALGEQEDLSRLVHHAREAHHGESIVKFGPRAARAAMAIESHREAVAHFRTLEPYLELIATPDQASILDDWAIAEYYLDSASSLDLLDRAIELHRSLGDEVALARALIVASRVNKAHLRTDRALACAEEAVSILESRPASGDFAYALSILTFVTWTHREDAAEGLENASQALAIAEQTGDERAAIHALNTKGHIAFSHGDSIGMSFMEESRKRSERSGDHFGELRAL